MSDCAGTFAAGCVAVEFDRTYIDTGSVMLLGRMQESQSDPPLHIAVLLGKLPHCCPRDQRAPVRSGYIACYANSETYAA